MADDIGDTIVDNAQAPKRASGDSGSVEMNSIPDQIAADRYGKAQNATKLGLKVLRRQKLVPPGAS